MKTKAIKVTVTTWTPSWSALPNGTHEDERANEEEAVYTINVDGLDDDEAYDSAVDFGAYMEMKHDEGVEETGRCVEYDEPSEVMEVDNDDIESEELIGEWTIINHK